MLRDLHARGVTCLSEFGEPGWPVFVTLRLGFRDACKAHQRFEDLKAAVTGRDEKSIINEVERGEDYLKGKWQAALESDGLTGESRDLIKRCYQSIKGGHDQMSQLKQGMESPSNA